MRKEKNYLYKYIYVYIIIKVVFKYFGSMYMFKIEFLMLLSYFYIFNIYNLFLFFKVVICFVIVD